MCGIAKHNSGKCVVFLIALAFLGHDLLMAGDAHARPDATADEAHAGHGHNHTATPNSQASAEKHPIASESAPGHESGIDACSTMRQLIQRPGTTLQFDAELVAVSVGVRIATPPLAVDDWWREPASPPAIVRSLFQVYLI
ncbi:MAG: hypothetical protein M3440_13230 [Chloroflexota bacterium]|nr:hypothetical protein [Chloroflexota bacterium]